MKINKKLLFTVIFICGGVFTSLFKISLGLGSSRFFFSGINLMLPTLGAFLGTTFATIFIPLFFIFKKMTFGGALTLGIPTVISSLFFSLAVKNDSNKSLFVEFEKFALSVILPLSCILLFAIHPVGNQAYSYSFYWFIPVILYCLDKFKIFRSVFSVSLITTFIAHAVGSIIWLYTIDMSAVQWLSLIPIVAIERFVFACGLTATHFVFCKLFLYFQSTLQLSLAQHRREQV